MKLVILNELRSKLLERTSLDTLSESVWKRVAALNTWGTNAIEGSTISFMDAQRILLDNVTPGGKPVRDVIETVQHEQAFRSLLNRRKREITLETVLELHDQVFRSTLPDAGQWRRVNVRIRGASFTPPRMEKVLKEMEKWTKDYRKADTAGDDTFSLGALMHFEFERIHPFSDGNGRVGRLLMNLHFMKRNWPPVHVLPTHRNRYLLSLNEAADGNFTTLENLLKVLMGSSLIDLLDLEGTSDDELISLGEASKIVTYDEKYLALRCKQGYLPALKSGRQWRTSRRALDLYQKHIAKKHTHPTTR